MPEESANAPTPRVFDPVVEHYKKSIDPSLMRENLKLTVEERMEKFIEFMQLICEFQQSGMDEREAETRAHEIQRKTWFRPETELV